MTEPRLRFPEMHVQLLLTMAQELGQQPRMTYAQNLRSAINVMRPWDERITLETAMDYVLAAAKEGHLKRVGAMFGPST